MIVNELKNSSNPDLSVATEHSSPIKPSSQTNELTMSEQSETRDFKEEGILKESSSNSA
jgi:hypothetical protein